MTSGGNNFNDFPKNQRSKFRAIKRLRVTIRFGPHIAGAQKCVCRTPETLPSAVPRAEAPPRGVFARADVPRGPRKRGALGEGPARPPLRPALGPSDPLLGRGHHVACHR